MTDMAVRRGAGMVGVVAAVGFVVAGCGSEQGAATPQPSQVSVAASPTSVDAEAKVWDPCSLPDSAVGGVGLNVGSKKKDVAGVDFSGWKVCEWKDSANLYSLALMSSEHTLTESRNQTTKYTDFTDVTVGGRKALQFRPVGAASDLACYVSVELPDGSVDFHLQNRVSAKNPPEPCAEVTRISAALVQYLPAN
ncbi:DUF3558 domain-containing protein [Nocardia coubleae]|uniref:DUF3558 domain-containing protein n=2 Tax=Nocardia coubleae TaxID=356147 RepID=A0A846WBW6_9NOCA|nr:DUF3558 domain-containing protein [Nocardia coubleae]